ncbi:hypothetical protein PtA15_12A7 [Puccinia triticina]|uniref:SAP domain-containing protein n=1 Tax=Puccinia triticina TaxID=208348 RepID=A0ABY7D008_9BASI|nr:uncharacterized protein PtA15_12A7 [Puccinia triticina]WAQ90022.1 hypothetical protein PtA15_12A7 [Puccinia triticina]
MAPVETPNKAALSASKVTELKALCSQNSLPVSGNKGELVNRLLAHFQAVQTSSTPQPTPSKDLTLSSNPPGPSTSAGDAPPASAPAVAASSMEGEKEKTAEAEREKRRQRAARFGLEDPGANPPPPTTTTTVAVAAAPDELKKQLRAKRFGIPPPDALLPVALDKPLADGKQAAAIARTAPADLEWEARKRKRAEKFGLVDHPPSSLKDPGFHRKNHRSRY